MVTVTRGTNRGLFDSVVTVVGHGVRRTFLIIPNLPVIQGGKAFCPICLLAPLGIYADAAEDGRSHPRLSNPKFIDDLNLL